MTSSYFLVDVIEIAMLPLKALLVFNEIVNKA
jgi:hypothetical protein